MRSGSAFSGCEVELENRINPNDAPVASLVRLPSIGMVRAGAIVAYREQSQFTGKDGNCQPFRSCDDLQKVSGIGPKTVQNINEWLKFE
ncbi:MAG: ComEA family DNA-binding protein [Planctomycetota bacterium]